MNPARTWLMPALALLVACENTDVIARRTAPSCELLSCEDAGPDASNPVDARVPEDARVEDARVEDARVLEDARVEDAGVVPPDPCEARTCAAMLQCSAPEPTVAAGDSCGSDADGAQIARYALCSCGDYVSEAELVVTRALLPGPIEVAAPSANVAIDGTLSTTAPIAIEGSLSVSGALEQEAGATVDASSVRAGTGVSACNCEESALLAESDVRELESVLPAPAFDAALLEDVRSDAPVALDCGVYRVARIAGPSALNMTISGHVVILVEGDVALDDGFSATLAAGAQLELYVLGNVRIVGALTLGGEDDVGRVRMNVLGTGTINLNAEAFLAGALYAPRAELVTRAELTALGPVFVRRAAPGGRVLIRYDDTHATVSCVP